MAGSELRGKLIQTASIAAIAAQPLLAPYNASKAGVISLIAQRPRRCWRATQITSKLRVPGRRRHRDVGADRPRDRRGFWLGAAEAWKKRIAGIPLGRPETPDDVAGVVAFSRAGLRLHDGAGDQARRRHGDGGLKHGGRARDRATTLTYARLAARHRRGLGVHAVVADGRRRGWPAPGWSWRRPGEAVAFRRRMGGDDAAMMLPSAVPMIGLYAGLSGARRPGGQGRGNCSVRAHVSRVWAVTGLPIYFASVAAHGRRVGHAGLRDRGRAPRGGTSSSSRR